MRKRLSQALQSVLGRGETAAASQDRLQQSIIQLTRNFPSSGEDLWQFFKENHYTERTAAFADETRGYLEAANKEYVAKHLNERQVVSLLLGTSRLAWDSQQKLAYLFSFSVYNGQGVAPGDGRGRRCPAICTRQWGALFIWQLSTQLNGLHIEPHSQVAKESRAKACPDQTSASSLQHLTCGILSV